MIFIFATETEAHQFRQAAPHAQIEICGVGGAECAATTSQIIMDMRLRGLNKRLVLAGIAGSYSTDDIAIGTVVEVVDEVIEALPHRFVKHYTTQPSTSLPAATSNSVNGNNESSTNAQIENMEGATFMAICLKHGVDFCQIRAISNRVGDPFEMWNIEGACEALSLALLKYITRA